MNLQENIKIKGEVSFTITDKEGKVRTHEQPNLITNQGMDFFVSKLFSKDDTLYRIIGSNPTWNEIASTSDLTNYHIQEIAIGTDFAAAAPAQTWDTQKDAGVKLTKNITNMKVDDTDEGRGAFFYQANFDSVVTDTLVDSNENELAIKEVMLLAKYGTFDSPQDSSVDPRIIVSRTVLQQPFIKYTTDKVAISWKFKLG